MTSFSGSSFKSFVIRLLCFFVVIVLLDAGIGFLLRKYYFRQVAGFPAQSTTAIDKAIAEVLVLGSSRAANIVNADTIENNVHMTCYNAGGDGMPVFYQYAVLKASLKRYKPSIVLLSFDAGSLSKRQDDYDRLSGLLPYYKSHPEIRDIVKLRGKFEELKLLSAIYPYNSQVLPIISGNMASSKTKYPVTKGYTPLDRTISGELETFDYTKNKELDTIKINAYKSIIQTCLDSNIRIYVLCPPYMIHAIGTDTSITLAKEIAAFYKVEFLDYSRAPFYADKKELFADYRHLNSKGVAIFNKELIDKIKWN